MGIVELFLIAVGLSMDAFAVSVCKGLAIRNMKSSLKYSVIVGLYFGVFQAVMPLIGYLLGAQFSDKITSIDHWVVFGLLCVIGGKMIWESFDKSPEEAEEGSPISVGKMLPLALATSIDALAVGVSFAFLKVDIVPAITFIGVITFTLSAVGVKIGNVFGTRFQSKAEFAGGSILVLMGVKVLLEHMNVISF